jgi:hypothetical protein
MLLLRCYVFLSPEGLTYTRIRPRTLAAFGKRLYRLYLYKHNISRRWYFLAVTCLRLDLGDAGKLRNFFFYGNVDL